jgi:hypothetical protein
MNGKADVPDIEAVKRDIKFYGTGVRVLRVLLYAVTAINIMRLLAAIWRM